MTTGHDSASGMWLVAEFLRGWLRWMALQG
jgi:hypothetical protein